MAIKKFNEEFHFGEVKLLVDTTSTDTRFENTTKKYVIFKRFTVFSEHVTAKSTCDMFLLASYNGVSGLVQVVDVLAQGSLQQVFNAADKMDLEFF